MTEKLFTGAFTDIIFFKSFSPNSFTAIISVTKFSVNANLFSKIEADFLRGN